MLSREYLRTRTDDYRQSLADRRAVVDLDAFLELEAERRQTLQEVESLKNQRNLASQEIARLKKERQDAGARIDEMREVGERIRGLDARLLDIEGRLGDLELSFPNRPLPDVPVGIDESANREERRWGTPRQFDFAPRPHWEIGEALGILDFDRATKITGTRFSVLSGAGARLERALVSFMLDVHTEENGYREVWVPLMVNADSLRGTGQLPKFEEDLFRVEGERRFYLIPTAEVPVTNLHRDEILEAGQLPLSYCAYTPCFRSEAGSYGKDTRGLIRQHQFDKVELVKFCRPEDSASEHEKLTAHAESILQRLGLPYRVVTLSTGDMGFSAAKTMDIEVWLPAQDTYREISSCSNFTDFQARRAAIRYRDESRRVDFVHTLNGSGLAVGRTLVAILENYQQSDGTVVVPEPLRRYMSGLASIGPVA